MKQDKNDPMVGAVIDGLMEVATKPGPRQAEAARLLLEHLYGHPKRPKETAT
jgi:hypothetical protein